MSGGVKLAARTQTEPVYSGRAASLTINIVEELIITWVYQRSLSTSNTTQGHSPIHVAHYQTYRSSTANTKLTHVS